MLVKFSGVCPKNKRMTEIQIVYLNASSFDKPNVYTKHIIEDCPFKGSSCDVCGCPIFASAPNEIKGK